MNGISSMRGHSMQRSVQQTERLPILYVAFFFLFTFSSLLPSAINLPLQITALLAGFVVWIQGDQAARAGTSVVLLTGCIVAFWFLLMWHPNVPTPSVAIIGFRKSVLALSGVVLGCAIPRRYLSASNRQLAVIMGLAVALSVIAHMWIPALLKLSASNASDVYTSVFRGQARMHGVFIGPFHAALAASFLIIWGMINWNAKGPVAKILVLVGVVGLYLTLVRTAYVALLGAGILFLLLSDNVSTFSRKILGLAVAALSVVLLSYLFNFDAFKIVRTIAEIDNDQRFLSRFNDYRAGIEYFLQSPLIGWGAGAAGDTLGHAFGGNVHITSHNLAMKIIVEGGVIGAALWMAFVGTVVCSIDRRTGQGKTALLCLALIFAMGLTGSAIEALPVTYILMVYVGLGVRRVAVEDRLPSLRRQFRAQ